MQSLSQNRLCPTQGEHAAGEVAKPSGRSHGTCTRGERHVAWSQNTFSHTETMLRGLGAAGSINKQRQALPCCCLAPGTALRRPQRSRAWREPGPGQPELTGSSGHHAWQSLRCHATTLSTGQAAFTEQRGRERGDIAHPGMGCDSKADSAWGVPLEQAAWRRGRLQPLRL